MIFCEFCGNALKNPDKELRWVSGWEPVKRGGGGTNALKLREPSDRYACVSCVDKQKHHNLGQDTLL